MKKMRILFVAIFLVIASLALNLKNVSAASTVYAGNAPDGSVYTISGTTYDEEGDVTYTKISYSQNTYLTTHVTDMDASGGSVDVSNDAQYIFIPARYLNLTGESLVSFKYKNSGVKKIAVHAEYAAGVNQGGVDYAAGYKYICVNAVSSSTWNVSFSKSIDGYDVLTIIFGSYATEIYDFNLVGFRLYFDYAETVNSYREFEIYGCTVHEPGVNPTFASDPKSVRLGNYTSSDVTISKNTFTVSNSATVSAKILDYANDADQLNVKFSLDDGAKVNFKLDGESVLFEEYGAGSHVAELPLTKSSYSQLDMEFTANGTTVSLKEYEFFSKPYVDEFSGSGYTVTTVDGNPTISYKYTSSWQWHKLSAPIRKYNTSYDFLAIEFELSEPTIVGIMIDDTYLRNHWSYTEALPAGTHTFQYDMSKYTVTASSSLVFYFDPAVSTFTGTELDKTVTFTRLEFFRSTELPAATITVEPSFTFNYDGKGKAATGAKSNCGQPVTYEYKLEGLGVEYYDTALPVDAGTYDVRVVSPLTDEYGKTYAYSKLVINKVKASKPTSSSISIDYANSKVYYDESLFAVSFDNKFETSVANGGYISCGMTLYFKYIDSNNYYESDVATLALTKQEAKPAAITINYSRERTNENIPTNVEYSTDGLTWHSGDDKKITLEAGHIYLFRTKATSSSFASEIYYLAVANRPTISATVELEETTKNSITVKEIEGAEYRLEDTVWQNSNVFTGLKEGSKVTVYIRIKGSSTSYASEEICAEFTVGKLATEDDNQGDNNDDNTGNDPVTPEPTPGDSDNGCGGSVIGSIMAVLTLTGAVVYLIKKRKEDE